MTSPTSPRAGRHRGGRDEAGRDRRPGLRPRCRPPGPAGRHRRRDLAADVRHQCHRGRAWSPRPPCPTSPSPAGWPPTSPRSAPPSRRRGPASGPTPPPRRRSRPWWRRGATSTRRWASPGWWSATAPAGRGRRATEFANDWDWDLAAEFHPIWQARNLLSGSLMEVDELVRVVDTRAPLRGQRLRPFVAVTPRPPV